VITRPHCIGRDIQRWGPPDQFIFFNPEEFNELLKRSQEETYLWINRHIELPEKLYYLHGVTKP
jgi:hypothetical protein